MHVYESEERGGDKDMMEMMEMMPIGEEERREPLQLPVLHVREGYLQRSKS